MFTVFTHRLRTALVLAVPVVLAACGSSESSQNVTGLSAAAKLGEQIFHDPSLSASGQLACSGCHIDTQAFADNVAVPTGGVDMKTPGFRNAPSLLYMNTTPAFFFASDGTPTGGFNRDGRAASLVEQAQRPLLAAHEMANGTPDAVVTKLKAAAYASDFKAVFGQNIFDQGTAAFDRALFALASYEREDPKFHPFSSRYDAFLAGKARLSAQEMNGLALFNNPLKGNCAACHPSGKGSDGSPPLFTDFSFDNLGVPRNADIPANADANYYDLGLCGPERSDLASRTDLCGAFKVPTLRNLDKTAPYFHNGRFATLEDAVRFYVRRDTNPEEWYPVNADGSVNKFDDLPAAYKKNVNVSEGPYNRVPGDAPALDESEIADLVAFLKTLTDGYTGP